MKNTKLLSLILKDTNNLITSNEYKESYSLGQSFSRNKIASPKSVGRASKPMSST